MESTFGKSTVAPSVFSADLSSSISSTYNHRSRHNPGTSSKTSHEVLEYGAPEKGLKIVKTASILPEETSNLVVSCSAVERQDLSSDRSRCNSRSKFNLLVTTIVVLYADLLGPLS